MTHKASAVQEIDKLLGFLHEAIDALVDLRHTDSPDLAGYPPGVPVSDDQ
jgi:hypothetical protein